MKKLMILMISSSVIFPYQSAYAQVDHAALVPLPSLDDFTKGEDGWGFGLGLGIEYESAYEGSDEYGFEAQPAGAVQWRSGNNILYFAGEAFGWRGLPADNWLFGVGLGFEEGREEGDSDEGWLNSLGDQEEDFELVVETRYALTYDWRYWLVARVVTDGDANLGLFGMGYRFGDQINGSGSEVNVVAVVHDSEYANKGFGIDATQSAASGLDETSVDGGLRSIGVDYTLRHYVN